MQPFYTMVIESMITNSIDLRFISKLLIWLNFLQIISYSCMPLSSTNLQEFQDTNLKWYEGYRILFFLARPNLILVYLRLETTELAMFLISIFIPLFLVCTFIGLFIFTYLTKQKVNMSVNNKLKKQLFKRILEKVIVIGGLYNYWLFVAFTENLVMLGVAGTFDVEVLQKGGIDIQTSSIRIFSILFSVVSLFFSFVCSYFLEQSTSILEVNLNRTLTTPISNLINAIKYTLMLLNAYRFKLYEPNSYESKASSQIFILDVIINIMVFIYFLCIIIDFFNVIPFSSIPKCNQYVLSMTICGLSSVLAPISFTFNTISSLNFTSIGLIILPLSAIGFLQFWKRVYLYLLFEVFQNERRYTPKDMKFLQKKISLFYNNKELLIRDYFIQVTGQINLHQETCSDLYCFCKSGQGLFKGRDETQFLVDGMQVERYLRHLCRVDLNRTRSERENFHLQFLRYMDFFSKSQKQTYSVQRIIDFLNEQDRMRKEISAFKESSLLTMLDIIKSSMKDQIFLDITDNEIDKMTLQIDTYIIYEQEKDAIKLLLQDCIQYKIDAYEKMRKSFEDISDLEETNLVLNRKYDNVEKALTRLYHRFPNKKNQNYLCFFLTEIKNSFKRALDISKQIRYSNYGGDFTLIHKNDVMDIFGSDVISATITMGKVWGKIQRVSDQLPTVLGYKKPEFQYINHIKEIMPTTVAKIHDDLIKYLMTTGQDNIIHSRRDLFLKKKSNYLARAQIFISMNLHYREELPYIAFAKVIPTYSGFFVVNNNGLIEGIDENVFDKFGFQGQYKIHMIPPYLNLDIRQCISNFDSLLSIIDPKTNVLAKEAVPFIFPNQQHPLMLSLMQYSRQQQDPQQSKEYNIEDSKLEIDGTEESIPKISGKSKTGFNFRNTKATINSNSFKQTSQKSQHFTQFLVDINIEKRDLHVLTGKYTYYVIEIKHAAPINDNSQKVNLDSQGSNRSNIQEKIMSVNRSKVVEPSNFFNQNLKNKSQENEKLIEEQKEEYQSNILESRYPETQRDDISLIQEDVGLSKINTSRQPNGGAFQQKIASDLNGITIVNDVSTNILKTKKTGEFPTIDASFNQDQSFINLNTSIQRENIPFLNTHVQENDSTVINLINDNSKCVDENNQAKDQDIQIVIEEERKDEVSDLTRSSSNSSLSENNKRIMLGARDERQGEITSIASSSNNISRNLDKYIYYEDFLKTSNMSFSIKLIGMIRLLEYAILIITTAVILILTFDIFNYLIGNLNSIGLNSNVTFYYFNFLSLSNNFVINSQSGFYSTQSRIDSEFSLLQSRLLVQYQNFSDHYRILYSDKLSKEHYTGDYIDINEPYSSQTSKFEYMSILNAMEQIVYHMQILQRRTASEWKLGMQESSYKFLQYNFIEIHEKFDHLQQHQLHEAQDYLEQKKELLMVITILLNIGTILIYSISFLTFINFEKSIKVVLKLIQTVSLLQVDAELERLKTLDEIIKESEFMMISYSFNLKQKEHKIISEDSKKKRLHSKENRNNMNSNNRAKQNVQIQTESLKLSGFYLLAILIYCIFLTYSLLTYILTSNFIENYLESVDYFARLSEMNIQLPVLTNMQYYLHQQKLSPTNVLDYTNSTSLDYMKNTLYDRKLESIITFQTMIEQIYSLSLFSSSFASQFYQKVNQDICKSQNSLIDSYFDINCAKIYNGQLTNGATSFMNYLYSKFSTSKKEDFKNQMDIDITSDNIAVSSMAASMQIQDSRSYFSSNFNQVTSDQKQIILFISIIYIIIITFPQIYLILHQLPKVFERFLMSKRLILFVPPHALIVDDSFIKVLKAISNNLNMTK